MRKEDSKGLWAFEMELEEVPETPIALRAVCLQSEEGETRRHYELGYLEIDSEEGTAFCQVIPILVNEDKALVAVPGPAWSRAAAGRFLPRAALSKAVQLDVAVAEELDSLGGEVVKIWMGYLNVELEAAFQVGESDEPGTQGFVDDQGEEKYPLAEGLLSAAADHFLMVTAASAAGGGGPKPAAKRKAKGPEMERRVAQLETGLEDIKNLLNDLPSRMKGEKAEEKKGVLTRPGVPMGLDPGVAAAALAAGIPEQQLEKLGSLLQRPNRMAEPARVVGEQRTVNVLSESEEEMEAEPEGEGQKATGSAAVEKAVVQLTKIMSKMTKGRRGREGLEGILDKIEGGGTGLEGSVGSSSGGRSKAAAYNKLKEALAKHPTWISQSIEQQMSEDFNSFRSQPGAAAVLTTSRAWVEHRSRIGYYPSTIRAAWLLAGVHDALKAGDPDQARARCCLALAAIDQSAMDAGHWTLAQEFLLELPPPYSSFSTRRAVEVGEAQSTRLVDDRFLEVMMWRLKDRDSFHESKKRLSLGGKGKGGADGAGVLDPAPKVKAKAKAKGKGQTAPAEA